ncbi:MAG: hypothetical protein MZU95_07505 [Desulfomicrobium escambiense]|nr:hypothetical protein [Desulfomicrobium escambiense]
MATPAQREATLARLMTQIKLTIGDGGLYTISFRDADPEVARRVVEATVTLFVDTAFQDKRRDSQDASRFIADRIAAYETKLVAAEERLKQFKVQHFGTTGLHAQDHFSRMSTLADEVVKLGIDLQAAERVSDAYRREIAEEEARVASDLDLELSGVLSPVGAALASASEQLAELSNRYTDMHPEVVGLRQQIARLESQRAVEAAARAGLVAGPGAVGQPGLPAAARRAGGERGPGRQPASRAWRSSSSGWTRPAPSSGRRRGRGRARAAQPRLRRHPQELRAARRAPRVGLARRAARRVLAHGPVPGGRAAARAARAGVSGSARRRRRRRRTGAVRGPRRAAAGRPAAADVQRRAIVAPVHRAAGAGHGVDLAAPASAPGRALRAPPAGAGRRRAAGGAGGLDRLDRDASRDMSDLASPEGRSRQGGVAAAPASAPVSLLERAAARLQALAQTGVEMPWAPLGAESASLLRLDPPARVPPRQPDAPKAPPRPGHQIELDLVRLQRGATGSQSRRQPAWPTSSATSSAACCARPPAATAPASGATPW